MAINIFAVDNTPGSQSGSNDIVGRFRSGYQINGRPATLESWRVTTGDPEVAEKIIDLFHGEDAQSWDTKGDDSLEVFTKATSVNIILDGPNAVRSEMALWGRAGAIHKCDGSVIHYPSEDAGKPCPSADLDMAGRKAAASKGTGCQPSVTLWFRLADAPELGRFKFTSGSWSLAKDIARPERDLATIDGPAEATLTLEVVEYEQKGTGKQMRFVKPVVVVTGPAKEA